MHFQTGYAARFSTYDVTAACPWELYRYTILVATILLGAVVGPVLWVLVIKRSSQWQPDERREVLGFLTSGYKDPAGLKKVAVGGVGFQDSLPLYALKGGL